MKQCQRKGIVALIPIIFVSMVLLLSCSHNASLPKADPPPDGIIKDGDSPDEMQINDENEGENNTTRDGDSQIIKDEPKDQEDVTPQPPKEPIIYVGQLLKISVAESVVSKSQVISQGRTTSQTKEIALTFDSGWLFEDTIPLLDLLDYYGIKATFFPRAFWVYNANNSEKSHPDLAKEFIARGHTVGNHSLTHPYMKSMSLPDIRHEIQESTRIIHEVTGVRPFLFRPPYGEYNQEILTILGEEGYPYTIMWTVDTHDWAEKINGQKVNVNYIVQRVLTNASDKGIILMHVGGAHTVQALPLIIDGLQKMGYAFTTVDKMLPPPQTKQTHIVIKGDTLYALARKYNTTVAEIIELNNL